MNNFYENIYSEKVASLKPSPIREIFGFIRQEGMISFAGGMPDPAIFPVEYFYEAADILRTAGRDILQYGATEGYAPLVNFIADWTAPRMGKKLSPEEMLITAGSSQVSDLLCWALIDRGDYILLEDTSFMGVFLNMHNHGAKFLTVPCDEDGMIVEKIPQIIENLKKTDSAAKIKICYTIANFHNPLGVTLSLERRKKLIEYAHTYGFAIFEDDPYGYVRFDGEHLPTLFELDDAGCVVYAGSFSKILAPGTRVGWCAGNPEIIRKMTIFKQGVDVSASVVSQALVYEYCNKGYLSAFLPKIIAHYAKKRNAMEEALQKYLPCEEVSWVKPQGGLFYWIKMKNLTSDELFKSAIAKKVAFVPGKAFYPNGAPQDKAMRLCYSFASDEQTQEGAKRLGDAMRELLA